MFLKFRPPKVASCKSHGQREFGFSHPLAPGTRHLGSTSIVLGNAKRNCGRVRSERTAENRALALIGTASAPSDLFNSSKRKKWDGTEDFGELSRAAVPPGPNPLADHKNSAKTLLRSRNCHKSDFGLSNQDNHEEYTRKLSSERSAAR